MSKSSEKNDRHFCVECGAEVPLQANRCWCCRCELSKATVSKNRLIAREAQARHAEIIQSRTAKLMRVAAALLVAAVAEVVFFGVFIKTPGLGVALAILLTPAIVRLVAMAIARDETTSVSHRVLMVFLWLLMGMAILVAAGITYLLTCKMPPMH
jgi:hypothetical protein